MSRAPKRAKPPKNLYAKFWRGGFFNVSSDPDEVGKGAHVFVLAEPEAPDHEPRYTKADVEAACALACAAMTVKARP